MAQPNQWINNSFVLLLLSRSLAVSIECTHTNLHAHTHKINFKKPNCFVFFVFVYRPDAFVLLKEKKSTFSSIKIQSQLSGKKLQQGAFKDVETQRPSPTTFNPSASSSVFIFSTCGRQRDQSEAEEEQEEEEKEEVVEEEEQEQISSPYLGPKKR